MRSISEAISKSGLPKGSVLAFANKFGTDSLRSSIAKQDIRDFHRRTGAKFGPLGPESGDLRVAQDGSYTMDYQLGQIHLADINSSCNAMQTYSTSVTLAGIHCFAAQDVETDGLYAIISLINVNPNAVGSDQLVTTFRTPITAAKSHDTLFRNITIGNVPPVGSGLKIHIALWDHESGDVDEIRDKIAAILEEGAKKAASAIAAGAAVDDPSITGGTVGKITEFEVGGVKPFHIITLGLAGIIANWLADDLLSDKDFTVPAGNLKDFADDNFYANSIRSDPDLPFDVQVNWPPHRGEEEPFNNKGALYKAYFKIRTTLAPTPCDPSIH